MGKPVVAIVRYEKPLESLRRAVDLCKGLDHLPADARVFIKPNIVYWTRKVTFPKWGVITTSRMIEDAVMLLKERGIDHITIGEGMISLSKDNLNSIHAFESLGYNRLNQRYGVRAINVFEREFREVDLGNGETLKFNADILDSDFVVDVPVLKTHAQTVVSLGIKNLKGMIDINSRKKCHNADPEKNLNYWVARLADPMPPILTILDGLYTLERGPAFDGRARRSNLIVASADVLSADMVGAKILGYEPSEVPCLVHAANNRKRSCNVSDVEVMGERIEDVASPHRYSFPYNEKNTLTLPMERMGIKGLSYRKYDLTMCTYCSAINGVTLAAVAAAWKGTPWDDVEVLTGKSMSPTPGMKKTILFGKCMYQRHKDNPDIQEMIPIKGCPPQPKSIVEAFHRAGIEINPSIIENADAAPGFFMKRYQGKFEYDESYFTVA
ncbi:MAG: DUF362 domain-containing protein [Deltaproteobacteria bacterium]|nr:DUF362 domain-containing protein [Deltaproteobacteria bacterium]